MTDRWSKASSQSIERKFEAMKKDLKPEVDNESTSDGIKWRIPGLLKYQRIKCSKIQIYHHRPYHLDRNKVQPNPDLPTSPVFLKTNMRKVLNKMTRSQWIPGKEPLDAAVLYTVETPRRARTGAFKRSRCHKSRSPESDNGDIAMSETGYDYDSESSQTSPSVSPDSESSKLTNIKINTSTTRTRRKFKKMGLGRQSLMMGTFFIHQRRRSRRLLTS